MPPPRAKTLPAKATDPAVVSTADLAKYLNVSQWTVSRAINGHKDISEQTRERVHAAMEELGFRPNPFARSLRGQSLGLIGVCSYRLTDPFMNEKVFTLQTELHNRGKRTLLEASLGNLHMEEHALEDFSNFHVDGVVMIHCSIDARAARKQLGKIPFLYIDPHHPQGTPSIMTDRYSAVTQLLEHLHGHGHRRFALLGISLEDNWRGPPLKAFAQKQGQSAEDFYFIANPDGFVHRTDIIHGARGIEQILRARPRPTAIVCMNDQVAFGAIHGLLMAGVRVPEEMSVVGFNREELSQKISPTITTIDQKLDAQIRMGCDLLLQQIEDPANAALKQQNLRIEPELIIGQSSGPVPTQKSRR